MNEKLNYIGAYSLAYYLHIYIYTAMTYICKIVLVSSIEYLMVI